MQQASRQYGFQILDSYILVEGDDIWMRYELNDTMYEEDLERMCHAISDSDFRFEDMVPDVLVNFKDFGIKRNFFPEAVFYAAKQLKDDYYHLL